MVNVVRSGIKQNIEALESSSIFHVSTFQGFGIFHQHQLPEGGRDQQLEDAGGDLVPPRGQADLRRPPEQDHSQVRRKIRILTENAYFQLEKHIFQKSIIILFHFTRIH